MRSLENENDPRILKELAKLMNAEILKLQSQLKKYESERDEALQQKFSAEESLLILRKKMFGKSSEKSEKQEAQDDFDRLRSADESELTLHSQNIVPPVSKKQTKKLDEEVIYAELSEAELKKASVEMNLENAEASQWEKLEGLVEESVMVTVIERKFLRKVIRRQKYKLKQEFNNTEKGADHG